MPTLRWDDGNYLRGYYQFAHPLRAALHEPRVRSSRFAP